MSEYLEDSDLKKCDWDKDIPVITCGTGSGKTHFVMTGGLAAHVQRETNRRVGFTLILSPTQALRDDILNNRAYNAVKLSKQDLLEPIQDTKRIRVACFAQLVNFLFENDIANFPDLIVFDEMDLLANWCLCFDGYINAWDYILSNRRHYAIVGLTATPKLLFDYIGKQTRLNFVNITPKYPVRYKANQIEIVSNSTAQTYLETLRTDGKNKVLVYMRSASSCRRLAEQYGEKAGYIVSKSNENYSEQNVESTELSAFGKKKISLRDYLAQLNKLPDEVEILFINDSYAAGCNIDDESVKIVIAETEDISIALQVKGRVRHNLDKFVHIYNYFLKSGFDERKNRAENFFNTNQDLKTWFDATKGPGNSDILVYQRKNGEFRKNPFAKPIFDYKSDVYESLNRQDYFSSLAEHSESELVFMTAEEVIENRTNTRFASIVRALNIEEVFGIEEGENSKIVTTKQLQEIARKANLKDDKGKVRGKVSFCEYINKETEWTIENKGPLREYGRKTCYEIVRKK